jgi:alanine-synthesizing transaminase
MTVAFSKRTQLSEHTRSLEQNAFSTALSHARKDASARGTRLLDLTITNPTTAGLPYSSDAILSALSRPESCVYAPLPLGLESARTAVSQDYARRGITVSPSRIAINASTSEAYAALFKVFCDPGDEVLIPTPSYPLLEWLAAFEGITLRTYPLVYAGEWTMDTDALARAVTEKTRLIVAVSPNNPTGSFLGRDELESMLSLGLPIVCDEVFGTFPLGEKNEPRPHRVASVLEARRGLVFALSGLSKQLGLPQMKLGWIAAGGDEGDVRAAMDRLETVLDAYLSVGAPVQHALPELLTQGQLTAEAIRRRTQRNLTMVRNISAYSTHLTTLDVEGGWVATLRVPEILSDEAWALRLLAEDHVVVQPGYLFDLTRGAHLVVSLISPESDLERGMETLVARIDHELERSG